MLIVSHHANNVGTTQGSHCVVADDRGRAWIRDQDRGQLLLYTDTLPGP